MKAEKEINRLWTEFNIALWCTYALYFTKQPMHLYRYEPKYRFLSMGNRTGEEKLKLTHYFSRMMCLSILSQGEASEKREVKASWTVAPNLWITGSLFPHNRGVPAGLGNSKRKRLEWWWRWRVHHLTSFLFVWLYETDPILSWLSCSNSFFFTKWAVAPDGQHDKKFAKWLIW